MADNGHTWVAGAGFGVLTVNSVLAIYRARDDAAAVAFVAGSYLTLLLLFGALREYERAAPRAPLWSTARARGRHAVLPLTLALGVAIVTCAVAIHRAAASCDIASVAFVAVSYGALLLLLLHRTLGTYQRAAEATEEDAATEPESERLRRRIWELRAAHPAVCVEGR